jgi:uroporphyrinogen decarboxylase
LISTVKKSNARICFHSEGDIAQLIDDLIEVGAEIFHPIEPSADKMANLYEYKKRYGQRLCIHGAIDA